MSEIPLPHTAKRVVPWWLLRHETMLAVILLFALIVLGGLNSRFLTLDNLLAVEVRKASNHQPIEHDQHKLKAMTDPHVWFAYWIGVLLALSKTNVAMCEVYVGGKIDPDMTRWLAGRLSDKGLGAP